MSQNQKQQPRFMKDHEITMLVNRLRDLSVKFHNHQSLRDRISRIIVDPLKGYWSEGALSERDDVDVFSPSDREKVREILLANGFEIKPGHTDLKEYVYKAYFTLLSALRINATPSAFWWANEQTDPHGAHYAVGVERAKLAMGDLTDDELANGVFMNGDGSNSSDRFFRPIAWLTAAKERIRWLSRQVTGLTDRVSQLQTENESLKQKLEAAQVTYLRDTAALDRKIAELMRIGNSVVVMKGAHQVLVQDVVRQEDIQLTQGVPQVVDLPAFGYCPTCGAPGVGRERRPDGNDTCQNGHEYPSSQSLQAPKDKQ